MSKEIELCWRCQDNPIDEWDTGKPYKDIYETEAHGYPVRCETCWAPGTKRAVYDEI